MKNKFTNSKHFKDFKKNSQNGGFIELVVTVLIALFIMKYLGITVSQVVGWFVNTFHNVLK